MKKILWATVIYPTPMFDIFLKEHLETICNQTNHSFALLLFLDCVLQNDIQQDIHSFQQKSGISVFFLTQDIPILNPSQIRKEIILFANQQNYDLLVFSDFDETMDTNRLEETLKQIDNYDFSFSSFYLTNEVLHKIEKIDFQKKCNTPKIVSNFTPIVDKNFIGLGNMSIKINNPIFKQLKDIDVEKCCAFDWFLATFMLIHGLKGVRIDNTFVNYRQHQNSYTGISNLLDAQKLHLGIQVKKIHYNYFSSSDNIFCKFFNEIVEVEQYVLKNEEKYIRIINERFDTKKMCWWENIKTLKEIEQWI